MRHKEEYCCYDQITTRIFAEGIKEQLGKNWDSCNDITIKDIKNISFRKCKVGEDPYADHCFPAAKYDEFVESIKAQGFKNIDVESVASQAMNSLAIPDRSCEEECTECN
jgi:hypothetical protein